MASRKGDAFYLKLRDICERLKCSPEDLLTVMFFESGVKPDTVNSISNATGLIQFMPNLLARWGYSLAAAKGMSDVDQLDLVERYLSDALFQDRIGNLTDLYLAVFWPMGVGKDPYTIALRDTLVYQQNKGLDLDGDGAITRKDIAAMMAKVAAREEVKQLHEEFRLVSFIATLPPKDAAERIALLVEYFDKTKPGAKLRALCARVESRPDAEMWRATNCATFTRWIWAAAGCPNSLCHMPDETIRAMRPAGPVDWVRQIAIEEGALRHYAFSDLGRGVPIRYFSGNNNDHMETCLAKPDASGLAKHGGGGRSGNEITVGVSDIRFSMGRPIVETFNPWKLLRMEEPFWTALPPAPEEIPLPPAEIHEEAPPAEEPTPEIPAEIPSVPKANRGSALVALLAVAGVIAATLFEVCGK